MLRSKDFNKWWFPQDFMRSGADLFVGYEASARLSEVASLYPEMIESRREGKYVVRRMRIENLNNFIATLPKELRDMFDNEYFGQRRLI